MSPAFDQKELIERLDNDWDFLAETVDMLSTDGRNLMAQIKAAADAGDAATLGRVAHTLKGMISNFCAAQAHASAFEVEQIGKNNQLGSAKPAIESLETRLETLIHELTEFLATRN